MPYHRTTAERRKLAREIAAQDKLTHRGCVVVVDQNAITVDDKKRLEKLGAVVIEAKIGCKVAFTWPPEERL